MDLKEINLIELKEKFKRAAFQQSQTTIQSANLTEREPRKTERRFPMSLTEFLIKETTQSLSSSVTTKTDTRTSNNSAVKYKTFVSATIAETQSTMAYAATSNAQALTTASWYVANARATVSSTNNSQNTSPAYKAETSQNECTITNAVDTKEPTAIPTQSSTKPTSTTATEIASVPTINHNLSVSSLALAAANLSTSTTKTSNTASTTEGENRKPFLGSQLNTHQKVTLKLSQKPTSTLPTLATATNIDSTSTSTETTCTKTTSTRPKVTTEPVTTAALSVSTKRSAASAIDNQSSVISNDQTKELSPSSAAAATTLPTTTTTTRTTTSIIPLTSTASSSTELNSTLTIRSIKTITAPTLNSMCCVFMTLTSSADSTVYTHLLHDTAGNSAFPKFSVLKNNKIKLKTFIFQLCFTIFIITIALYQLKSYQYKHFTHSFTRKQYKHSFYQTLQMHDISSFHTLTSLLPPIASPLFNKHTTHPCSTQMCMQVPIDLTPITTLAKHAYHVFGLRILAINRNRPSRFSTTTPNSARNVGVCASLNSCTFCTPYSASRGASLRPTPQTSSTGIRDNSLAFCASVNAL
jgi:hypothetical protein